MQRLDPFEIGGDAMDALAQLDKSADGSGLDPDLLSLVRARTLQLIGGDFGDSHCRTIVRECPHLGEKIAVLADWYTSRQFSARDRAALSWTEQVMQSVFNDVADKAYAEASFCFSNNEIWALTVAVTSTCARARLARTFRMARSV